MYLVATFWFWECCGRSPSASRMNKRVASYASTTMVLSSFGAGGASQLFNNLNDNGAMPPPGPVDSINFGQLRQQVLSAPKPKVGRIVACSPSGSSTS